MIKFKLNGKEVQAEEGQYILQVAEKYGVEIPTMCHHKALTPAGMCRLCTVELFDGRRTKFVTACNYPVWEGMEVRTDTESVHQGRKLIVEMLYARCPEVPILKKLAGQYGIEKPRFKLENDDCILCGLCVRMCEKMGNSAISLTGRGVEMKVDTPFHVQTDICMACGACAFVCPTGHITIDKIKERISTRTSRLIPSEYDMGLKGRKPIYVPYAQAVPNMPAIDRDVCMHFKTGGCQVCQEFCGVDAIDHAMQDEIVELDVGSIILAPGFTPFDPTRFDNYNYAKLPNVVTSMEFERILSASGPMGGHLVRISDHKEPKKIAWFQCVGSRDMNKCDNAYCSSVCCMYAIKEAMIAKEHAPYDLDCAIFFMDMRTHGKEFERYYNKAQADGVRFVRSRVHTVNTVPESDDLEVRYVTDDGEIKNEVFDMIVLSVGLEISKETRELAERLGIELTPGNFTRTSTFTPVDTSKPGIFVCGAFQGPKDIPQAVVDSSAAAAAAGEILSTARNTRTKSKESVPQTNVVGDRPRIGVFVCRCGSNIGGVIDVPSVAAYAATLPYVEFATDNMYSCSQDAQSGLADLIRDKNLNRIVVAACTPKTHEPLFQETLLDAGLNKYLFEMTNIRNHDSWVHKNNPQVATEKAKDLVRMAVCKVALMKPLKEAQLEVNPVALVVGGGISGMVTARSLSGQGYETHLVEKEGRLGGQALNLYKTIQDEDIQKNLAAMIDDVRRDDKIHVHLNSKIVNVNGFVGNFETMIEASDKGQETIKHGVAILATGGAPLQTEEYGLGRDDRIVSTFGLDKKLMDHDPSLKKIGTAAFIQCVGSREPNRPYCSRVCCTHSIHNALELKKLNPDMGVYILYRDIRTYGEREYLYKEARKAGVIFIRYSLENKPQVTADDKIRIRVTDHVLGLPVEIEADLLTLATAIVPSDNEKLAGFFKVPLNDDGLFVEKHAKLGPSEFATDGVYLCGLAHYPKPIDESIAQSKAAASRAVTLLSQKVVFASGTVAEVNPAVCSACGVCVSICPYSAPSFIPADARFFAGKAQINPVLCKGCGLCVASCRSGAIALNGFDNDQIFAQIFALKEAG